VAAQNMMQCVISFVSSLSSLIHSVALFGCVQYSKNSSAATGRLSIHCTVVIAIIGLEQGSATDTANSLLRMMHQVLLSPRGHFSRL